MPELSKPKLTVQMGHHVLLKILDGTLVERLWRVALWQHERGERKGLFARHSCCSSFSSGTERGKSGRHAQLDGGGMKRVISRQK